MPGAGKLGGRFALVIGGALGALLLLEVILQLAGLAASLVSERGDAELLAGRTRVLSLGDSNTYGLYVEPREAYPQRLEALWNADLGRAPIQVVNLAFPGTNSSTVRKNLPGLLRRVRPDWVTVLVGTNDLWTAPIREWATAESGPSWRDRAWQLSRLYRLYYIRFAEFEKPVLEGNWSLGNPLPFDARKVRVSQGGEEFEFGFEPAAGGVPDWQEILVDNLDAIAASVAERGAELVLLTYLSEDPPYSRANAVIRKYAEERGLPLVDAGAELAPRCPRSKCPELLSDQHPSSSGYALVADLLFDELRRRSAAGAPAP